LGLGLSIYFIRGAGVGRTLEIVRAAGVWLPLLVALQILIVFLDALALNSLVTTEGERQTQPKRRAIPRRTWFRASAIAYACGVFLPAGRAAGEALRAAALSPTIGASRAAGAGARVQACSLLGTATACAAAALVTFLSGARSLAGLLVVNAAACLVLGGGVFVVVRSTRLTSWLRRLFARVVREPDGEKPSTRASVKAYGFCVLARSVQTLQYGFAILAVGGRFTVTTTFTTQGIQLLGSSAGDLMPGQLGAMEGVYNVFSETLGISDARALSLVLIMRGALVGVALAGLLGAALMPLRAEPPASPASHP
jgi:uncharacterized membrane protein YbhN (UPF0104 family)